SSGLPGRTTGGEVQDDLTNLIQTRDKKDWNDAMKSAVHNVANGRPTAADIKMVTDALIKSGQFEVAQKAHPGLSDSETIRMMQWDHGVGIDCAGYVQEAFLAANGGTRADYRLDPDPMNENLSSLKGNPNFTQVKPENVKPGDLIILDPPKKNDVGHTVLVRDHHVASKNELKDLHDSGHFAKPGDVIHLYEVDASFGAGKTGDLNGGLQRKTWVYNETTGKWGQLAPYPSIPPSLEMVESDRSGPYDHPMNGIFHPKGK
ncbi:MAG TPA: hypothetical protein VFG11_11750, partial [Acidobacteriota bacterium]|nr:hypothetical protein [Acidobacteriota bacterium]